MISVELASIDFGRAARVFNALERAYVTAISACYDGSVAEHYMQIHDNAALEVLRVQKQEAERAMYEAHDVLKCAREEMQARKAQSHAEPWHS